MSETAEFLLAEADEFADEFADDGTYADKTLMDYLTRRIDALEGFLERLRGVRRFRNNNTHLVAPPVPPSDEHPDGLFKVRAGQEVETTDPAIAADLAALPNMIEVQRANSSRYEVVERGPQVVNDLTDDQRPRRVRMLSDDDPLDAPGPPFAPSRGGMG